MRNLFLAAALFAATSQAATVAGSVEFDAGASLGVFGRWTINWSSTDGIKLDSVAINLATSSSFLDTTIAAPGALLWLDFSGLSGSGATSFSSITPGSAGTRNGATNFALTFNDFGTGESFSFDMDIDQCGNGLAGQNLTCSLTNGTDVAGATAAFSFSGPGGYGAGSRTATFADIGSTGNPFDAAASFRAEVPEPGTYAMLGSALAALGVLRRKSRQS
jgi:hypothetical protein